MYFRVGGGYSQQGVPGGGPIVIEHTVPIFFCIYRGAPDVSILVFHGGTYPKPPTGNARNDCGLNFNCFFYYYKAGVSLENYDALLSLTHRGQAGKSMEIFR